jgi:uncharacterized repeat protein (TIGR03803 family)
MRGSACEREKAVWRGGLGRGRLGALLGAALVAVAGFSSTAAAQLATLHSFTGDDGAAPVAGLIADPAGNLYGTTQRGGAGCGWGCGTVFQLTPSGSLNVLYSFSGSDGGNPDGALIADAAGNLYGTTQEGGAPASCNTPYGCGTVFQLTPSGTLTVLHIFTGSDGRYPHSDLIADAAGNLYGTTFGGGAGTSCIGGCGTVFELMVPASFTGVPGRQKMNTKRLGQGGPRMGRP